MKRKSKVLLCISALLFLAFGALIALLLTFDRQAVGPQNSVIGFAGINHKVFTLLGQSNLWYEVTEALGLVAFAAVGAIGIKALVQLFKRKSLLKIDFDLWLTAGFLGVMAVLYVLFEIVIINYRPVLEEGQLAASFPSSHTMLVFCVMWATLVLSARHIPFTAIRVAAVSVCGLIIVVTTVGRLLSGVHWFTDIVGSVLISSALGCLYSALTAAIDENGKHDER